VENMFFKNLDSVIMVREPRRQLVKEVITSRVAVNESLYHASARNKGLLIHIRTGRVFSYFLKNYQMKVMGGNAYLKCHYSDHWEMVYIGLTDTFNTTVEGLAEEHKTIASSGNHFAVLFAGEYPACGDKPISVKNHVLVLAMVYGYDVLKAIGEKGRTHEIHHTFGRVAGNGIDNLQMLTISNHRQIEAKIKSDKKKLIDR
jgi:hypothetical protein